MANGAYGERMEDIAAHGKFRTIFTMKFITRCPAEKRFGRFLKNIGNTHVAMVHCETTSGILNDIADVAGVVKGAGKIFIVDAMSSFGGVDIPVGDLGIDFLS